MREKTLSFPSHLLLCLSIFLFFFGEATPTDTLTPSDSLTANQTLISATGKFELRFFSRGSPARWYVGIWFKDIPVDTNVWVANRDNPVYSSSGKLEIGPKGTVQIVENNSMVRWSSTNQSTAENENEKLVLQLLDTGNLVLREADNPDPEDFIWESFDHPTDTIIPGQKLGLNLKTGLNRFITSWQSSDDPRTGNYTFKLDPQGDPEVYMRNDDKIMYRSGPWVGQRFSGVPEMKPMVGLNFTFYKGEDEVYYKFEAEEDSGIKSRLLVTSVGYLERWTWVPDSNQWSKFWYAPKDQCDDYRECGPYGNCDASQLFVCQCVPGFEPRNPQAWELRDGTSGCARKTNLDCKTDGFRALPNMKLPESTTAFVNREMDINKCREMCRRNCNCTAYADADWVQGVGSGCVIWTGDLMDMRDYAQGGQNLYIRLAASDLASSGSNGPSKKKRVIMGVGITLGVGIISAFAIFLFIQKRKKMQTVHRSRIDQRAARTGATERSQDFLLSGPTGPSKRDYSGEANSEDLELPLFDFDTVAVATNHFSDENKLGQGGFGRVYKGVLIDGQEIAVKRLSRESGQGAEEFKNEVKLIAKLQHRNLVRLLGCCVDLNEKMLVYEYLQNRSLDSIIFHKERNTLLDWQKRFNIICGIARGLLYLHQDSRYRIIHRDLKASNILLDSDMNPKISDFGMARIFGGDQTEGNTRKVVGTYGYMSPEYAMDGLFSIKSDVFSFGVLVLEIVCGKKNRGFYNSNNELNLLGHSWKLWREGKGTELLDPAIANSYSIHEVLRCVQVGLLCVQERPEERPTMASVVLMLSSESAALPQPKVPGFCLGWNPNETDSSSSRQDESFTVNQVTVTMLDAR